VSGRIGSGVGGGVGVSIAGVARVRGDILVVRIVSRRFVGRRIIAR
jgi:hypothetical protein